MCCQDRRTCKTLKRTGLGQEGESCQGIAIWKAELKTELRDPRRLRYRKKRQIRGTAGTVCRCERGIFRGFNLAKGLVIVALFTEQL